ncbi:hypothetical protein [Streptomyces sp. ODS28]|uniref:hypothetical protein n=1 Tax=Streptomyces sp. ODS28 TaxID=3136688 RepID=UPI0031EB3AA0
MGKFKRVAIAGAGILAFSGAAVGAAQAADTPPPGKEYTVHGVHNCMEAVDKSHKELGTPESWKRYSCMMNTDDSADLEYH